MRGRADRSLATVLFVDIVDSTRIASEVGDRRWRELLGSFRRAVRRQLRARHGQEQDTAGDGFFATFDRPAGAVRAAAGIVDDVQKLGLDARCGIHTGELERIDGRLGGIAAHIGARVMALAGPAEVLVTGTVHDLVVGGGIGFEAAHETQLKGVPGRWPLYRVTELDGVVAPAPLPMDVALDRLRVADSAERRRVHRPRLLVVGFAAAGALALAALGAVVLTLPRDNPSLAGDASPSAASNGPIPSGRPPSMVRIDPETNRVVDEVVDKHLPIWKRGSLFFVDGVLWQDTYLNMVRRDIETGMAIATIDQPVGSLGGIPAFGSLWFDVGFGPGLRHSKFHRLDPLSGRLIEVVTIDEPIIGITTTRTAFVFLTDKNVLELDPQLNEITDTDPHGLGTRPHGISSVAGNVWICECGEGRITEWDMDLDVGVRTVEFAQRGFFLDDQRELSQGSVSTDSSVVWLMDGDAGTITPVDTASGEAGQPLGIPRLANWHVFGLGSIWIATDDEIYRLDIESGRGTSIPLPAGVQASGMAIDEQTGLVWVSNYIPHGEPLPEPLPLDEPDSADS